MSASLYNARSAFLGSVSPVSRNGSLSDVAAVHSLTAAAARSLTKAICAAPSNFILIISAPGFSKHPRPVFRHPH